MIKNYLKKYLLFLGLLFSASAAFAQTGSVTGTVLDETKQPLIGAAVSIDGTTIGASTDVNGKFTLSGLQAGKYAITAKYIGYVDVKKSVTITSGQTLTVNFQMSSGARNLNEVVVIGYGSVQKKDLTGSITTVTAKDFNQGVVTTPEQLIQGKAAGVSITSNGGAPGSGSTIRIRGGASISGNNNPLIVIDGVPLDNPRNSDGSSRIAGAADPLSLINPNDIESFSILKDASATAIYGNRASSGVILITTKKGKNGKPVIAFNTQFSIGTLPKEASVLSPSQFRDYINSHDTTAAGVYRQQLGTYNTDWQKQIYQTSYSTDDNVSISGSTAKNKLPYRVSVGYTDQDGILKTSSLERFTGDVNLSPSLFKDHLKINFNFKGAQVKQRFANEGAIGSAVNFNPTVPVKSGNDNFGGFYEYLDPTSISGLRGLVSRNPVGLLDENDNRSTVYRAITSLNIDYKFHFFPDLHAIINLSYDGSKGSGTDMIPGYAASNFDSFTDANGKLHSGLDSRYSQKNSNTLGEGYFSYAKNFKSIKSHVDAVAGYSFQDFKTTNFNYPSYFADGFQNPLSLSNYPFDIQEYQLTSLYGRINYSYNDKYLLTGTLREDVSTKFAPGIRTGYFPSVAAGWRISQEDFLKGSNVVSNLKLRVEYGKTGNQEGIGNYDYLSPFSLGAVSAQYQFGNNFYQTYRPAAYYPNRTWEATATTNAGFDYGFFNERISGTIDYYYRKTSKLLALINEPAGSNFGNQIIGNVGDMQDKGLEFNINARIIDTKNLTWTAGFNVTVNRNKITNLTALANPNFPGLQTGGIAGGTGNFIEINEPGYAKNSFYAFHQVYGTNGKPLDGVFVDTNGDGIINENDKYTGKSPDPQEYYGLSSDVRYKKWVLGFVARANVGNYAYNNVQSTTGIQNTIINTSSGTIGNGSSNVLVSGLIGNGGNDVLSDYYIQNASFFRMDNVHLGYNFGKVFGSTGNLRISANVQNVFIITDYKGVDPEIPNGGSPGIDNNFYPRPRTYVIGLNLSL